MLALCFVRKLMDFMYSQSELYWLDHILPDEHRRKKEDGLDPGAEEQEETKVSRVSVKVKFKVNSKFKVSK